MALWWAWASYAWLTNWLNPEEGAVRLAMFGSMAAMLIVSLAVPHAFGVDGVIFGVAYLIVRVLDLVLYAIAGRGDRELFRAILRITPGAVIGPSLIVVAGFTEGSIQLAIWIVALSIDYLWVLIGGGRGWRVSPEHFVERHGLIVIIALGESIVAIGVGAAGVRSMPARSRPRSRRRCCRRAVVVVLRLGRLHLPGEAGRNDRRGTGPARARPLHLPAPADGRGDHPVRARHEDHAGPRRHPLEVIPAIGLCGGLALYLVAHVALRLRIGGGWGPGRPTATVVLRAAPSPRGARTRRTRAGRGGLCGPDRVRGVRYRYARAWIRSQRGAFTMEEASRIAGPGRGAPPGQTQRRAAARSFLRRRTLFSFLQHLAQLGCERFRLTWGLAVLAAHESAVAAREDHRLGAEAFGDGGGAAARDDALGLHAGGHDDPGRRAAQGSKSGS